ncbi:MAG: AraC family transcriptional regulator ligand-binding domain-containing protein [Maricaulaceae bacterium]
MSASLPYAVAQVEILDQLGFSKEKSLEIMGITDVADVKSTHRIASHLLNDVFSEASKDLDDASLALRVGNGFRIANFKGTGKVYSYCENLTEVLHLNARYQPLAIDIAKISTLHLTNDDGEKQVFLDFSLYDEDPSTTSQLLQHVFGAYGTALRWLTWSSAKELKGIYLQLDAPVDNSLYKTIFQCPVHFNQPYNRIEFDPSAMDEPLSTYDPVRKAQYISTLESFIDSKQAHSAFIESLQHTVRQGLSIGRYSIPAVADSMKISETRLRQHMKMHDIKYRDYLEDTRKALFQEAFSTGLNFTEIALELGYNDQAAFSKAFKKWYNMSPTEYKDRDKLT